MPGPTKILTGDTAPTLHAANHENGGSDEINVAGLSGVLADAQTPATHAHTLHTGTAIRAFGTDSGGDAAYYPAPLVAASSLPLAANFATYTRLTAGSVRDGRWGLVLQADGHGATFNVQGVYQTIASNPYTYYAKFRFPMISKPAHDFGISIYNSSTLRLRRWCISIASTSVRSLYTIDYLDATQHNNTYGPWCSIIGDVVWLRIQHTAGGNHDLAISSDGNTWQVVDSRSATGWLTATHIGFAVDAYNSAVPNLGCEAELQYFSQTAPSV